MCNASGELSMISFCCESILTLWHYAVKWNAAETPFKPLTLHVLQFQWHLSVWYARKRWMLNIWIFQMDSSNCHIWHFCPDKWPQFCSTNAQINKLEIIKWISMWGTWNRWIGPLNEWRVFTLPWENRLLLKCFETWSDGTVFVKRNDKISTLRLNDDAKTMRKKKNRTEGTLAKKIDKNLVVTAASN